MRGGGGGGGAPSVAARKERADLVHHARTHGGDENATAGCFRQRGQRPLRRTQVRADAGQAPRVTRPRRPSTVTPHAPFPSGPRREYLRSIGLEPETRADGSWIGDDPNAIDPMDHPAHPFNALVRRRGVE